MKKEQIQKNIDEAVKLFRDTLEKTYLKEEIEFYGCGSHSFLGFLSGKINVHRLNNGNLKVSGEIHKVAINKECKGLPRNFKDWDIFPMVVTLFNKDIIEKKDDNKKQE